MKNLTFPFPYTIKPSKRAKRISLGLSQDKGVVLTLPEIYSEKQGLSFLYKSSAWILKKKLIWEKAHQIRDLPLELFLPLWGKNKKINYLYANKEPSIEERAETWFYEGPNDKVLIYKVLNDKTYQIASDYLSKRLDELSKKTGLSFSSLRLGKQKTIWGACNRYKKISLNTKLIFLPLDLIDYVLIHELSHTIHMNHGDKFWALLGQYISEPKKKRSQLKCEKAKVQWWYK